MHLMLKKKIKSPLTLIIFLRKKIIEAHSNKIEKIYISNRLSYEARQLKRNK